MSTTDLQSNRFWNVPNTLTLSRLVLAGVCWGMIAWSWYWLALAFFGIAAITDAFDGYLARRLNQSTAIGRQLDPLVDKLLISGTLIYLVTIHGSGIAPWMVTVVVVRELVIQWLRSLLEGKGEAFGARMAGKFKTTFQCLAIVFSLLVLCLGTPQPFALRVARDVLIWSAVLLTIYSGIMYISIASSKLRESSS